MATYYSVQGKNNNSTTTTTIIYGELKDIEEFYKDLKPSIKELEVIGEKGKPETGITKPTTVSLFSPHLTGPYFAANHCNIEQAYSRYRYYCFNNLKEPNYEKDFF